MEYLKNVVLKVMAGIVRRHSKQPVTEVSVAPLHRMLLNFSPSPHTVLAQ
jgi:hypothetical protein